MDIIEFIMDDSCNGEKLFQKEIYTSRDIFDKYHGLRSAISECSHV